MTEKAWLSVTEDGQVAVAVWATVVIVRVAVVSAAYVVPFNVTGEPGPGPRCSPQSWVA